MSLIITNTRQCYHGLFSPPRCRLTARAGSVWCQRHVPIHDEPDPAPAQHEERPCPRDGCGEMFVPGHGRQIYCRKKCEVKVNNERRRERYREGRG